MKLYQIDAFTPVPFRGNPAGVCLLEGPRPDDWMQSLAMEMNLIDKGCYLLYLFSLFQHMQAFFRAV